MRSKLGQPFWVAASRQKASTRIRRTSTLIFLHSHYCLRPLQRWLHARTHATWPPHHWPCATHASMRRYYDYLLDLHFDMPSVHGTVDEYLTQRALKRYSLAGTSISSAVISAVAAATAAWADLRTSVYSQDVNVRDTTGVTHLPAKSPAKYVQVNRLKLNKLNSSFLIVPYHSIFSLVCHVASFLCCIYFTKSP